jgi:drug/metabolite transporter (DMT)-like permease
MSIVLAYIFYFVAASASPLQRRWLAKSKNPENKGQIAFAFHTVLILVIGSFFLPFFEPLYFSGSIYKLLLLAATCGVFGMGFFISSYVAQKHIDAGVTTLVNNINTPITIIIATLLLGEKLTPIQILGTVVLLFAIVVVSKKHRIGKFKFDKYFLLMVLSGVFLGFVLVAERALQKTTGFTAGTMLSWWGQFIFLGAAMLITKSKHEYTNKDVIITGIFRFFQALSWVMLVFVVGNISLVSSITTFKVVIMFIAGALFLGEKDDLKRKVIGSIIAVIGLLLMK